MKEEFINELISEMTAKMSDKGCELAFERFYGKSNDDAFLGVLPHFSPRMIACMSNDELKIAAFVLGAIAGKIPNSGIKSVDTSEGASLFQKYAAVKLSKSKKDQERYDNIINRMLSKITTTTKLMEYLKRNIIREVSNFNYAKLLRDLMKFEYDKEYVRNSWGRDFYSFEGDK